MLDSQRIADEIKEIEARQERLAGELNAMTEVRDTEAGYDAYVAERRAKVREMNAENAKLEDAVKRQAEALAKEDREAQAAMARHADTGTESWTPELREFRDLGQQVNIGHYLYAAEREQEVTGEALEYKKRSLGDDAKPEEFPLEMLLNRDEHFDLEARVQAEMRAVITGTAAGTASMVSFVDRLFATSDGAYIGAMYPSVGPGRHAYPIITGTTVAQAYARDADETPAGGLTIVNADPERVQHSYEYASVDELTVPGVAAHLASDLRMSLMSGVDRKVIRDGLTALTDPTATTTVETLSAFLGRYGAGVDGIGAKDVRDVRILLGIKSYETLSPLTIANIGHFMQLVPHDRCRACSHIAAPASDNQAAIVYRTGMPNMRRLIVPTWRRGELLRDRNSQQTKGNVRLTGVMYVDVIMVAQDLHDEISLHLA